MTEYLLISSRRYFERDALSEAWYVLSDLNEVECFLVKGYIPGLRLLGLKNITSLEAIDILRQYQLNEGPLMMCLTIKPIQYLFRTDIDEMVQLVEKLTKDVITATTRWKIALKKRQTQLRSEDIIKALAEVVTTGKVDLTNPEKIILVEILGPRTGISLISPQDILRQKDFLNTSKQTTTEEE